MHSFYFPGLSHTWPIRLQDLGFLSGGAAGASAASDQSLSLLAAMPRSRVPATHRRTCIPALPTPGRSADHVRHLFRAAFAAAAALDLCPPHGCTRCRQQRRQKDAAPPPTSLDDPRFEQAAKSTCMTEATRRKRATRSFARQPAPPFRTLDSLFLLGKPTCRVDDNFRDLCKVRCCDVRPSSPPRSRAAAQPACRAPHVLRTAALCCVALTRALHVPM